MADQRLQNASAQSFASNDGRGQSGRSFGGVLACSRSNSAWSPFRIIGYRASERSLGGVALPRRSRRRVARSWWACRNHARVAWSGRCSSIATASCRAWIAASSGSAGGLSISRYFCLSFCSTKDLNVLAGSGVLVASVAASGWGVASGGMPPRGQSGAVQPWGGAFIQRLQPRSSSCTGASGWRAWASTKAIIRYLTGEFRGGRLPLRSKGARKCAPKSPLFTR